MIVARKNTRTGAHALAFTLAHTHTCGRRGEDIDGVPGALVKLEEDASSSEASSHAYALDASRDLLNSLSRTHV